MMLRITAAGAVITKVPANAAAATTTSAATITVATIHSVAPASGAAATINAAQRGGHGLATLSISISTITAEAAAVALNAAIHINGISQFVAFEFGRRLHLVVGKGRDDPAAPIVDPVGRIIVQYGLGLRKKAIHDDAGGRLFPKHENEKDGVLDDDGDPLERRIGLPCVCIYLGHDGLPVLEEPLGEYAGLCAIG